MESGLDTPYEGQLVYKLAKKVENRPAEAGRIYYFFDFLNSTILNFFFNFGLNFLNLHESLKYAIYISEKVISVAFQWHISCIFDFQFIKGELF